MPLVPVISGSIATAKTVTHGAISIELGDAVVPISSVVASDAVLIAPLFYRAQISRFRIPVPLQQQQQQQQSIVGYSCGHSPLFFLFFLFWGLGAASTAGVLSYCSKSYCSESLLVLHLDR